MVYTVEFFGVVLHNFVEIVNALTGLSLLNFEILENLCVLFDIVVYWVYYVCDFSVYVHCHFLEVHSVHLVIYIFWLLPFHINARFRKTLRVLHLLLVKYSRLFDHSGFFIDCHFSR